MGQMWGRPIEQVVGRPHFDALPDLAGQGFEQVFADVLTTGRTAAAAGGAGAHPAGAVLTSTTASRPVTPAGRWWPTRRTYGK